MLASFERAAIMKRSALPSKLEQLADDYGWLQLGRIL
jgi:hypothetical protein